MGTYSDSKYEDDQTSVMQRVLTKAGYQIIYPNKLKNLCCGMPYSSKGFNDQADQKATELFDELYLISKEGEIPILFDTSPCVKTLNSFMKRNDKELKIYDSVEFLADHVIEKLNINKKEDTIAIHSTCSTTKMELTEKLIQVANSCVSKVVVPEGVNCCGFAGDRGFSNPELNKSALAGLSDQIKTHNCSSGYSTSRTCEIGLSLHSGIEYNSIIYLVDECSEEKVKT